MEQFELITTQKGAYELSQADSESIKTTFEVINQVKAKEKEIKDFFKETLNKLYLEKGVNNIDSKFVKITLVPATITTQFDEKRFKEENPELYKKYQVSSSREASVRITIRDDE